MSQNLSYIVHFAPIKIHEEDGKFILPIPGMKNKTIFHEEACTLYALPNLNENYSVIPTLQIQKLDCPIDKTVTIPAPSTFQNSVQLPTPEVTPPSNSNQSFHSAETQLPPSPIHSAGPVPDQMYQSPIYIPTSPPPRDPKEEEDISNIFETDYLAQDLPFSPASLPIDSPVPFSPPHYPLQYPPPMDYETTLAHRLAILAVWQCKRTALLEKLADPTSATLLEEVLREMDPEWYQDILETLSEEAQQQFQKGMIIPPIIKNYLSQYYNRSVF